MNYFKEETDRLDEELVDQLIENIWICKYCGENEFPSCHYCVRQDGKMVEDEILIMMGL